MPALGFVVPVLPGKEQTDLDWMEEMTGPRREEYESSWRQLGVTRHAVWDFVTNLDDTWERADYEIGEVIHAGDDLVAGRVTRPVQGKTSGIADVLDYWCVMTFREGKVLRCHWYATRARALEAVGLSE